MHLKRRRSGFGSVVALSVPLFLQSKNAVARVLWRSEKGRAVRFVGHWVQDFPAELSDDDPDPMHISIFQIDDGKTNKDAVYGQAMRHKGMRIHLVCTRKLGCETNTVNDLPRERVKRDREKRFFK
jgi:hypothetical protein